MKVLHDGTVMFQVGGLVSQADAVAQVQALGVADFDAAKVERLPVTPDETRAMIREGIAVSAGDTLSLLGTASDGAQLLLFHLATLVKGLSTANSLADVRDATDAFLPLADAFLADVDAGTVQLPFKLKGEAAVMGEIGARATAVTRALTDSAS